MTMVPWIQVLSVVLVTSPEPEAPSFLHDVLPVLTKAGCNSGACHGAMAGKGGLKLSLRGYDPEADHFVLVRQHLGRRVDLADPEQSLLLLKATGQLKHGGGQRLRPDDEDARLLRQWLASGAPGPKSGERTLQRLEVQPAAAVAKPEESLRLQVIAHYSNGQSRDVTRWTKFSSTDESVAAIDDSGTVTVKGCGETALSIWFSNQVAVATLTVPFPHAEIPTSAYVCHNFIDEHINQKLAQLRLPASPPCTDREFIRRVFLDVTGTLPRPEQVAAFLADQRPDKRAVLIDQLLASPEFVDYWTAKWADLFLVSSAKLPQSAVWAFHSYLRRSVAQNKPWNQLAREILTATGSNLEQGQANYFLLHQEVAQLTEVTSVTFLGMSLTCARCHNHPLEKWTQDQYWAFANLLSRVGIKSGDRPGEVWVQPRPDGDVLHPRRGVPLPPTPLDGTPLPLDAAGDRRQVLADWLTHPDNPYFAKAIINRVWKSCLGRGLIEPEDDVRLTNPPSNPALLAALEKDFVANGYDVRRLLRLILNSAAYQRSSVPVPENAGDERFYARYLPRRLPAEVILDAYSQITGVPTPFTEVHAGNTGGISAISDYPLGTRALQLPDAKVVSRFLDTFGRPARELACACERDQESSVRQALHLSNGQTLNDKLRSPQSLTAQWVKAGVTNEQAIELIFELALARPPTAAERSRFLEQMTQAEKDGTNRRDILDDVVWAVLTSREFLFNH